jgi:hypothetical protein
LSATSPAGQRLWVVPRNDGEALAILDLLRVQSETVLVTAQPWGASWARLEAAIQDRLREWRAAHPGAPIYGIELAGPNDFGAIDIDHHFYAGDDRSNPLSSLEQCAILLGVVLNRHQQLVAINDRAWIPGLAAAGASPEEIEEIRGQDRAAQGLGPKDREQAQADLDGAVWLGRLALVRCPGGINSFHNDLLYGRADESLLIAPELWSYAGARHRELLSLALPEKHWSGGSPERGYFGIERPSPGSRERILIQLCGAVPAPFATLL